MLFPDSKNRDNPDGWIFREAVVKMALSNDGAVESDSKKQAPSLSCNTTCEHRRELDIKVAAACRSWQEEYLKAHPPQLIFMTQPQNILE